MAGGAPQLDARLYHSGAGLVKGVGGTWVSHGDNWWVIPG